MSHKKGLTQFVKEYGELAKLLLARDEIRNLEHAWYQMEDYTSSGTRV